jgi:hypothetical protein
MISNIKNNKINHKIYNKMKVKIKFSKIKDFKY